MLTVPVVFVFILLMRLLQQTMSASSCYESFEKYTLIVNSYEDNPIWSSTIICCNVSSIMDLHLPPIYNHTKREYRQYLQIRNSSITTLPKAIFSKFSYMQRLYLSEIHLRNIESGAFENLERLEKLYLNNNELTKLTNGMFSSLPHLYFLELSRNKISHIETNTFTDIGPAAPVFSVLELHLEHNLITIFEDSLFKKGIYLDLSGNPLKVAPKVSPRTLNLSNTSLTNFDVDISNGTTQHLDLSSNHLYSFNFSLIPVSVRYLNLSNNAIFSLNADNYHKVSKLYLRNNQIRSLKGILNSVCTYSCFSTVDLSYNKLGTVENLLFIASKIRTIYNQIPSVSELNLSHNKILKLNEDAFSGFTITSYLILSHNNISKIPKILFNRMDQLQGLDLSSNRIEGFQFGTFEGLSRLRILNLSNNNLLELSPHILHSTSSLRRLYFDNNKISSLESDKFATYFPQLVTISLNHNPWKCEDLVSIRHTLLKQGKMISSGDSFDVENHYGIACTTLDKFGEFADNSSVFSVKNLYNYVRKSMDEMVSKSKIYHFLSEGSKNTIHFQSVNKPISVRSKIANHIVAITSSTQILVFSVTLLLACFLYVQLRRLNFSNRSNATVSRLELISAE